MHHVFLATQQTVSVQRATTDTHTHTHTHHQSVHTLTSPHVKHTHTLTQRERKTRVKTDREWERDIELASQTDSSYKHTHIHTHTQRRFFTHKDATMMKVTLYVPSIHAKGTEARRMKENWTWRKNITISGQTESLGRPVQKLNFEIS